WRVRLHRCGMNARPETENAGGLRPRRSWSAIPARTGNGSRLQRLDLVGLQALLALHDEEGDLLAFLQRLEAGALDRAEMHEQVGAALRGDEAEALGVVEPLDGTGLTIGHVC